MVSFDNFMILHNSGILMQENHYYPYGMLIEGLSNIGTGLPQNMYRYTDKEAQNDLNQNLLDFGWRQYDPVIARWHVTDPAEQFYNPYLAIGANPVSMIDPDGRKANGSVGGAEYPGTSSNHWINKDILSSPTRAQMVGMSFGFSSNMYGPSSVSASAGAANWSGDISAALNGEIMGKETKWTLNHLWLSNSHLPNFDDWISSVGLNADNLESDWRNATSPILLADGGDDRPESKGAWLRTVEIIGYKKETLQKMFQDLFNSVGNWSASGNTSGLRAPDFYSLNVTVSIPNPFTASIVGLSGSLSVDRHGQIYLSPFGISVGKSAFLMFSGSVTANYMFQTTKPTHNETFNFLSGHGISAGAGFIGGINWAISPSNSGTNNALGLGFYTPQIGASVMIMKLI